MQVRNIKNIIKSYVSYNAWREVVNINMVNIFSMLSIGQLTPSSWINLSKAQDLHTLEGSHSHSPLQNQVTSYWWP